MSERDINGMRKVCYLYGGIIIALNILGYILLILGGMPYFESESFVLFMNFFSKSNWLTRVIPNIILLSPVIVGILYCRTDKPYFTAHFINIPFSLAAIGASSWILSYFYQLVCLFVCKQRYDISICDVALYLLAFNLEQAIFIFTLGFGIMGLLHRKIYLPRFFPEGHLNEYTIYLKPSIRFIVIIFYLSICFFPMFYLGSLYFVQAYNNNLSIPGYTYFSIVMIVLVSSNIAAVFSDYLHSPLKKLKKAAEEVKNGNIATRVSIISNDPFGEMGDSFNEMTDALVRKNREIEMMQNSVLRGLAVMVESRDNSTGGHINRTSDCVKIFVEKLMENPSYNWLTPEYCDDLIKAAPMHDLGKISVKDAILTKDGRFTDTEYEIMKVHSEEGARIVEQVLNQVNDKDFKTIAVNVAHYHHERWDGSGYPQKLSGLDIPLEARIMALADVFDALVSKRCYKEKYSYEDAFRIIEDSLGTHFDPELGKLFIECRQELEKLYDSYSEE